MGIDHEAECALLAEQMTELLMRGMGTRARWALQCALGAAQIDGAVGTLTLTIPKGNTGFIEAEYRTDWYEPVEMGHSRQQGRQR